MALCGMRLTADHCWLPNGLLAKESGRPRALRGCVVSERQSTFGSLLPQGRSPSHKSVLWRATPGTCPLSALTLCFFLRLSSSRPGTRNARRVFSQTLSMTATMTKTTSLRRRSRSHRVCRVSVMTERNREDSSGCFEKHLVFLGHCIGIFGLEDRSQIVSF